MRRVIVINAYKGLAARAAVLEEERLVAFEWEPEGRTPLIGQIHRAHVLREATGIGGVLVQLAEGMLGILHQSDLLPAAVAPDQQTAFPGRKDLCSPAKRLPKPGTTLVVQVKREGFGAKDPQVTTDISFPGRRLVLRPYRPIRRISKGLSAKPKRDALHKVLRSLSLPGRAGVIVRTAGISASPQELHAELAELVQGWKELIATAGQAPAPCILYREPELLDRIVRDAVGDGPAEIIVDNPEARTRLQRSADAVWGKGKIKVSLYRGARPIFHAYKVEKELTNLYNRRLSLPGGGSMVIEYTEAFVAVDVNSGSSHNGAEETALRTNLEAAEELFRQLRLRDIGGLIICDFIAMQEVLNREQLEDRLQKLAEADRGRVWASPMLKLGFVALTRRTRQPVQTRLGLQRCPACHGSSWVAGDYRAAADFLDEVLLRGAARRTCAQVSSRLLAILSKSEAFTAIKKKFKQKLVIEELPEAADNFFAIR